MDKEAGSVVLMSALNVAASGEASSGTVVQEQALVLGQPAWVLLTIVFGHWPKVAWWWVWMPGCTRPCRSFRGAISTVTTALWRCTWLK